ncbi:uncharacterized protein LOC103714940 isoform X2 [Phoenix dactylifera]|uniref:Uncharacterized protein LOC103714940 isoform X2 n=1 Tax=Phoenix dactylifera TaxID=42345 RepID=A0A8B9A9U5_PHODC|nr:uncharacterized protein LOC103714940 isoform X2 [Phoenix dactylifera]
MARAKITMAIEVIPPEGLRSPSIPRPVESPLQLFEIFAYPASFPMFHLLIQNTRLKIMKLLLLLILMISLCCCMGAY